MFALTFSDQHLYCKFADLLTKELPVNNQTPKKNSKSFFAGQTHDYFSFMQLKQEGFQKTTAGNPGDDITMEQLNQGDQNQK